MAFPQAPTGGQVHNGYKFSSSKGAWEKIAPILSPDTVTEDAIVLFDGTAGNAIRDAELTPQQIGDGRFIPEKVMMMYDGSDWVDNSTIPGWYACIAENAGVGCPNLVDRFVMGKVVSGSGSTGGTNSYTLTTAQLPAHGHGMDHGHGTITSSSTTHNHTVGNVSAGGARTHSSHTHPVQGWWGGGGVTGITNRPNGLESLNIAGAALGTTVATHADHNHSVTGGGHTHTTAIGGTSSDKKTTDNTGSGSSIDNRPAYYSIIFIRKCA